MGIHVSQSMHEIHACQNKIMLFICMSFFILGREAKTLDISIYEMFNFFSLVVVILKIKFIHYSFLSFALIIVLVSFKIFKLCLVACHV
jgi:hypothetical protein